MLERPESLGEVNILLSLLPEAIRQEVMGVCSPLKLALGDVLISAGAPVERVFFLSSGIASVVVVTKSGRKIESGIVGREGFVPTGAVAGAQTNLTEIVTQAPGEALFMSIRSFDALLAQYRVFSDILVCALHVSRTQVEYTASSNATQSVTERLARWLLMCHDRVKGNHLPLTHDFLSTMLAVRRASVTDALHVLESHGFIRSERGRITIRNRETLETYAHDLYGMPEEENNRMITRFLQDDRSETPLDDLTAVGNGVVR
ncbi:Crp/Fnr family transcriptional regulator (plasmid) [Agrobacterium radiobacter]|jgi:CRP-like cAMP-binding protein|uniref:Putative transcriptional regulator, Crp/Fnr family, with N-terminal cNMP-binding domain n=1 Tax=Agrobacterium tumefaciens str. B6 TaxID=1183423 RepID=A0A822VAS4_AGRTU|nr:Crp/Fnr family transcriptional regulator [Agrobacterium tumefaciens]KWT81355.1 Crp/Fnr family transcriptional regulator [Agrobacterium tumefaciens str. B6]MQB27585.1 Crp/Fnr family transcriptional regulator [Agrobacterium tumefaciens]NTA05915.1 Crp/Fnr family transcriptional regulator [Agrobacterium tumefaciens]NTA94912.1 Crp/Fnr family transcriptional regulator [Agrobacterium tumefaciens]NTB13561.1 Crp/Fnr family transcriptional regulator [Agrobacterium tumefaciens]